MIDTDAKNYWIAGRTLRRGDLELGPATAFQALRNMANRFPHGSIRSRAALSLIDCDLYAVIPQSLMSSNSVPNAEPVA